jgi:hypothetical protein
MIDSKTTVEYNVVIVVRLTYPFHLIFLSAIDAVATDSHVVHTPFRSVRLMPQQ